VPLYLKFLTSLVCLTLSCFLKKYYYIVRHGDFLCSKLLHVGNRIQRRQSLGSRFLLFTCFQNILYSLYFKYNIQTRVYFLFYFLQHVHLSLCCTLLMQTWMFLNRSSYGDFTGKFCVLNLLLFMWYRSE
jgi:hypothetical protein